MPTGEPQLECRLRYKPSLAEIDALERREGPYACLERWGAFPGSLRKLAPVRRRPRREVCGAGERP